jgi:hypothetical protein
MGERRVALRGTCGVRSLLPASVAALVAVLLLLAASPAEAEALRTAHEALVEPTRRAHMIADAETLGAQSSGTPSNVDGVASGLLHRAEEIEAELALTQDDEGLLAKLTRTRINAADAMIQKGASESKSGTEEVREQFALAAASWSEYLKAAKRPSVGLAALVAPALFQLAELSSDGEEALKNVKAAAAAEKIVAEGRPGKNSWSTLAFYELFAQRYKAADESIEKAISYAQTKFERESIEKKFEEVEKKAKHFGRAEKASVRKAAEPDRAERGARRARALRIGGPGSAARQLTSSVSLVGGRPCRASAHFYGSDAGQDHPTSRSARRPSYRQRFTFVCVQPHRPAISP